jgi:hypothetical protein
MVHHSRMPRRRSPAHFPLRALPLLGVLVFAQASTPAGVGQVQPPPAAAQGRGNIVVFVADDHGQDTGAYGNTVVKTPHLDALTAEGVRFRHAYATTASCSASR